MTLSAFALSALWAVAACDTLKGGDAGGGEKAAAEGAGGADAGAADPAEKARFVKAYVEAACALKTSNDLSKAVEQTRQVYEKHGFNQVSYAAATRRWAGDPDVIEAQKKGTMECPPPPAEAPPAPAADAAAPAADTGAPGVAPAAAPGADAAAAGGQAAPAPAAGAEVPSWAVKPADAVPAGGDAKPAGDGAAEPAKVEGGAKAGADAKPAETANVHAGDWVGTVTSKDVSAGVKFKVAPDGGVTGEVAGKKPKSFTVSFTGEVRGDRFVLNGRKKESPDGALLNGTADPKKGVVVGEWNGTISNKRQTGTWRAAKE